MDHLVYGRIRLDRRHNPLACHVRACVHVTCCHQLIVSLYELGVFDMCSSLGFGQCSGFVGSVGTIPGTNSICCNHVCTSDSFRIAQSGHRQA